MFLQRVKELTVWRPVWSFRKKPRGRPSKESLFSFLVHWNATWRSLSREKDKKQILKELNLPLDDFPRQKPRKLPKPSKKDHTVLKELGFLTYILGHQGRDYWGGKKCSISWPIRAERNTGGNNKVPTPEDEIMANPLGLEKNEKGI